MDLDTGAAPADSPPADPSAAPAQAPSAPAQPADPNANVPFHQHPRWQQVMRENRTYRDTSAAQAREIEQFKRELAELKTASQRPTGDPQQQFARQQAIAQLKALIGEDPDLKQVLDLIKRAPDLLKSVDGVQQLSQAQTQAQKRAAADRVGSLVKDAGIQADGRKLPRYVDAVATEVLSMPDGRERFQSGDLSVLDDAFNALVQDGFFSRRDAANQVIQTKNNVRNLPPRPAGGGPGQEPSPKLDPEKGDAKRFMNALGDRAAALLGGRG